MNKIIKIGLTGALLLMLLSCHKNENAKIFKIGEIIEIELGKTVDNSHYGLSLSVEDINDSRCPTGVDCFWEGTASVKFNLITQQGDYSFVLDTHEPPNFINDTIIENLNYQLIDVLPYPDANENQKKQTVKILISE